MVSSSVYISNLFVDNYSVEELSIGIYVPTSSTGTIGTITVGSLTGASGNFSTITGSSIISNNFTSTPLLTGSSAFFSTITGTNVYASSEIFSSTGTFIYSNSNTGKITILQADNYYYPATGIVGNFYILDTITGSNAFITTVTGVNIFCDSSIYTSAFFTEITGETIIVPQLTVASITGAITNIVTLTGTNFYSSEVYSTSITGNNISTSYLTSSTVTGTSLYFSTLTSSSLTGSNIYATQSTVPSVFTDVISAYTSGNPTTINGTKFLSSTILSMRRLLTRSMLATRAVTSWTTEIVASSATWVSVCWSPENSLFVSVAPGPRVQISSDGINWSIRSGGAYNWSKICWSSEKNLFLACAYASSDQFMYSSDGNTWTAGYTLFPASPRAICYSSELGIFCAIDPTISQSMISSNGTTWTSYSVSNMVNGNCQWSSELELFCAVGSSFPYALISSNGQNWTPATTIYGDSYLDVCWAAELNLFCAVGGLTISTSSNGLTWKSIVSPIGGALWSSVSWSPELKVLVVLSSSGIGYSNDGITWSSSTVPQANNWGGIVWSKALGIFCAVASNGTNRVMISRYVKRCY